MLQPTIELFDQYCAKVGENSPDSYNPHLAAEVKERLQQLQLILARVSQTEQRHDEDLRQLRIAMSNHGKTLMSAGIVASVPAPKELSNNFDAWIDQTASACLEIRLMTEAFYYFAARIRTIVRHSSIPLPLLSSFECVGVRNVRNHLIEHPEGAQSQVFAQSFAFGGPNGPVLKSGRPAGQENIFPDQGLHRNAREFNENLIQVIRNAMARA